MTKIRNKRICDRVEEYCKLEFWENIPEPLACLINNPYLVEDYSTNECYENSYNWFASYYLDKFDWKIYQEDALTYQTECKGNNVLQMITRNPFFCPDELHAGDYIYIRGIRYTRHDLNIRQAADFEILYKCLNLLRKKTTLDEVLLEYHPGNNNLIEFLNPMVYSILQMTI